MGSNLANIPYVAGHIDSSFNDARWFTADFGDGKERFMLWFLGDRPEDAVVICNESPPNPAGRKVPAHSHASDQVRLIIDGSFRVGNRWYRAGDMRVQSANKIYGPELVGPEGCKQVIIFSNRKGVVPEYAKAKDRDRYMELETYLKDILAEEEKKSSPQA